MFSYMLLSVKPSETKFLTGDVDLREAQVDVPLYLSYSRV